LFFLYLWLNSKPVGLNEIKVYCVGKYLRRNSKPVGLNEIKVYCVGKYLRRIKCREGYGRSCIE